MELILSRSVTKTHVYLCATCITLIGMLGLVFAMFFGTVAATNIYHFGQPIPLRFFFRLAINGGLLAGAARGIALLSAGLFGGRKTAIGFTVSMLVIDYFAWIIAQWWPRIEFLKPATLFYYVNGGKLARGWPTDDMAILIALIVVTSCVGGIAWQRRDLPL